MTAQTAFDQWVGTEAKARGQRFYTWWCAARLYLFKPGYSSADLGEGKSSDAPPFCGECGKIGPTNDNTDNCFECDATLSGKAMP